MRGLEIILTFWSSPPHLTPSYNSSWPKSICDHTIVGLWLSRPMYTIVQRNYLKDPAALICYVINWRPTKTIPDHPRPSKTHLDQPRSTSERLSVWECPRVSIGVHEFNVFENVQEYLKVSSSVHWYPRPIKSIQDYLRTFKIIYPILVQFTSTRCKIASECKILKFGLCCCLGGCPPSLPWVSSGECSYGGPLSWLLEGAGV